MHSLLARLTQLNCYGATGILQRLCVRGTDDWLAYPAKRTTLERIAALTQVPCSELHAATAHCFAHTLTPPGEESETLELEAGELLPLLPVGAAYDHLRSAVAGQFCPRCLEEATYHRVGWLPIAVSACLRHEYLLLDHCPDCWAPVTIDDIAIACCRRCGADLTQAVSISVAEDAWGQYSQRLIQAWLGLVPGFDDQRTRSLPAQTPAERYHLLDGLRQCITRVRADWKYLHRVPPPRLFRHRPDPEARIPAEDLDSLSVPLDHAMKPAESYCLYATALKALADWPRGFHEFLRAFRLRDTLDLEDCLRADLGNLYGQWLQKHWRQLPFVQEAFHQYLLDNYALAPSVAQPEPDPPSSPRAWTATYVTVAEAARMLDLAPQAVQRLVQAGLLFQFAFPGEREVPRYDFIRRAEVIEWQRRWNEGVSLAETAQWLGLAEDITLDLVRVGLLFAARGPDIDGSACWSFSKQAVTACLYEVTGHLPGYVPDSATLDLAQAAQVLAATGLRSADLLKSVAERKLAGYAAETPPNLSSVMFTAAELGAFVDRLGAIKGWVAHREIARRMGVKVDTVLHWVKDDLLAPLLVCAGRYFFGATAAETFVSGHIFGGQAAEILDVNVEALRKLVDTGQLRPVSGPGVDFYYRHLYRRQDVERLRAASEARQSATAGPVTTSGPG